MNEGINKKTNQSLKSYLILLISVTLATYFIYLFLIPALMPPEEAVNFKDIVYLETTDDHSSMKFINTDGSGAYTHDVIFSIPRYIKIFDLNIPIAYRDIENQIAMVTWSPDGKALVFTYPLVDWPFRYPAIMTSDGKIFTCPQDESLYTFYLFPVQLIDQERIVINVGSPFLETNYLAVYNMRECKQESVYFDGDYIWGFSISSKGWLAVYENILNQQYISIFDEHQNLVKLLWTNVPANWMQWSRDGNQLLYIDTGMISSKTLYNYDIQTDKLTILAMGVTSASFSPDGEKIVYEKNGQIFIQDLKSKETQFLTNGTAPQWRP